MTTIRGHIDAVKTGIATAPSERDTRQAAALNAKWLARVISHFSSGPRRAARLVERRPATDCEPMFADTEATWKPA